MWLEPSYFYSECKLEISDFPPGLGEHSEIMYGFPLERMCAVCVDIEHSSTKLHTALINVRPRTLIFPLCVVLTWTSDTHTCMYNSK